MRLFGRKSKWDRVRDSAMAMAADSGIKHAGKVTLGVVGGAIAATAASAAVSSARKSGQS
jgi:hypothetical protein